MSESVFPVAIYDVALGRTRGCLYCTSQRQVGPLSSRLRVLASGSDSDDFTHRVIAQLSPAKSLAICLKLLIESTSSRHTCCSPSCTVNRQFTESHMYDDSLIL